jgi:NADP-dependent 3-hydroxy acid dehydrogenase YdfG
VVYAATKHALSGFAKGFRLELKPHGVRVTEVAPGMVDTAIRENSQHPAVIAALGMRKFKPLSSEDVAESVGAALTASAGASVDLIELRPRDA